MAGFTHLQEMVARSTGQLYCGAEPCQFLPAVCKALFLGVNMSRPSHAQEVWQELQPSMAMAGSVKELVATIV